MMMFISFFPLVVGSIIWLFDYLLYFPFVNGLLVSSSIRTINGFLKRAMALCIE